MSTRYHTTTLGANDDGRRLDRVLRKALPGIPLSRIYRALRSREITVNGRRVRHDTRVSEGDTLEIADSVSGARISTDAAARRPSGTREGTREEAAHRRRIASRIAYESDDLLVVAKERGELTHDGAGSLEERMRAYLEGKVAGGLSYRPGPVHRLDRNTSGLVVFGVSLAGAQAATTALQDGTLVKEYVAILEGRADAATWVDRLERNRASGVTMRGAGDSGKRAVTRVDPFATSNGATLALVRIETGRTHQIRAQARLHGHPLLGDRKYGSTARGPYFLHAAALEAVGPARESLGFHRVYAEPPQAFRERIVDLFGPEALESVVSRLAAGLY
ncbi:MAG: RluA family pseudouridine synthase [Spirochaetota bacterium]